MLEKWSAYQPVQNHVGDGDDEVEAQARPRSTSVSPWWQAAFVTLLTLNVIYGLWLFILPSDPAPNTVYLKAKSAITYSKQRIWRPLNDNVYTGPPRPELDQAWRDLIRPMAIKIDQSQANELGADTIAFKDGSGYMAEMAVFHELHCIKRIKQHLSLEYYHPNMTEAEAIAEEIHINHCLEYLRRAAMCRGDTSLATFFWKDGKPKTRNWSDHICVDWDKLYTFALDHSPLITDYSTIVGPGSVEGV